MFLKNQKAGASNCLLTFRSIVENIKVTLETDPLMEFSSVTSSLKQRRNKILPKKVLKIAWPDTHNVL